MRVTKDNLRPHINQLVHKEQAALEHLLVNQHRTFGLCGHHEQHTQQIRGQSRPRRIAQGHERTVQERINLIMVMPRDEQIISMTKHLHAQTAESIRNDA